MGVGSLFSQDTLQSCLREVLVVARIVLYRKDQSQLSRSSSPATYLETLIPFIQNCTAIFLLPFYSVAKVAHIRCDGQLCFCRQLSFGVDRDSLLLGAIVEVLKETANDIVSDLDFKDYQGASFRKCAAVLGSHGLARVLSTRRVELSVIPFGH